ncbi:hypothetical protein NQZ68_034364 [Dissostichus eleginoides]|nr:hypothetical protein NQZ68_034364 [Dissostichus eleginoides]
MKERFSIPVDNILSVEDETGTEVDDYAFPDLLTTSGICFVIKDELNDSGEPSSASGTDTLSVTSKSSSENDFYSGTLKRFRKEEAALQGPQAKNLVKQVLLTKPGGSDVLKEYEEKGTISPATRKVMVNILVADMAQSEGRIPQRLIKEKYALGIVTLFPSLQDPHGKTGYEHFYDGQKGVFPWLLDTKGLNQRGDEPSLESPEWDSDMASILLLLHLLSPQPAGRKKTQKISVAQAIDHLVVFHKSCRSLDEHLQSHMDTNQPYLLASGTSKEAIGNFFILIDKKLIPCEATTSLAAIDELFKLHFVLGTSYDPALKSMYIFLQTTVYNIDVDTTSESPKVKELRTKFVSNV